MKAIQFSPNPAIGTNWFIEKDGKIFLVQIKGTICTGALDKFKILGYILKYEHRDEPQEIDAPRLQELISQGVVRPNWNSRGSLTNEIEEPS